MAKDPDLAALRTDEEFKKLIATKPTEKPADKKPKADDE